MIHFYTHHLIRFLGGKEASAPSCFYKGRGTHSERSHNLFKATQPASGSVRIWVQDSGFPWQWSLHSAGLLFYVLTGCLWLWLVNMLEQDSSVDLQGFSDLPKVSLQVCVQNPDFWTLIQAYESEFSEERSDNLCKEHTHSWFSWSDCFGN